MQCAHAFEPLVSGKENVLFDGFTPVKNFPVLSFWPTNWFSDVVVISRLGKAAKRISLEKYYMGCKLNFSSVITGRYFSSFLS
jgi:hypothetical protein